jgi:DHA1 family inner membrane transport protein
MIMRPVGDSRRTPAGLLALAVGSFGIGLTEFVIAGLLPQVGGSLRVSDAAAGWLISGYALAVAVGAIVVTAATSGFPRKAVLTALVALFVVGNLLCALHGHAPQHAAERNARAAFDGKTPSHLDPAASCMPAGRRPRRPAGMHRVCRLAQLLHCPLAAPVQVP